MLATTQPSAVSRSPIRSSSLIQQLEKEKARGRTLYEQFDTMQREMQRAFGIEESSARKGRARTPTAILKSAATAALRRLKQEGKTATAAKGIELASVLVTAKKNLDSTRPRRGTQTRREANCESTLTRRGSDRMTVGVNSSRISPGIGADALDATAR